MEFYITHIDAVITKKEVELLTGRANTFFLSDGLKIFLAFDKEDQMAVGDSIYKESNTYIYDVYKKDKSGQYEYSGTYDYNDVY